MNGLVHASGFPVTTRCSSVGVLPGTGREEPFLRLTCTANPNSIHYITYPKNPGPYLRAK